MTTAALRRRLAELEQQQATTPGPRLIVLAAPCQQVDSLSDGRTTWTRTDGEDEAAFLARVERDLGDGPPVLLAAG